MHLTNIRCIFFNFDHALILRDSDMHDLKKKIIEALENNDLNATASLAQENRKVISMLVRMAYDKETLTGWRAIKAIGVASRALIKTDYDYLRETVRKLLWSLTDESGGIGWSAPEILGEIVCADINRFADIVPIIINVYDIEEEVFRSGVLYALLIVSAHAPNLAAAQAPLVIRALEDTNPVVRYYAIEIIKKMKSFLGQDTWQSVYAILKTLQKDTSEVWIYTDDCFSGIQIRETVQTLL